MFMGFIRYNPSLTLKLPKMEDSSDLEKHLYTQDEIDKILTSFKDDDVFTCAFITSCFTGMRPGELCALTWEDVDFENKVINVRHSIFDKKKNKNGRLRNVVEIRDVADVLGHKDIETTENYYISSTDETRKNVTDSYENAINLDVIEEIIEYKIFI